MEWRGEATVLARRKHGEHALIVDALSPDQGLVSGVVPGGASRKRIAIFEPGNRLSLHWRARLEGQLGTLSAELLRARSGLLLEGRALDALNASAGLLLFALAPRDPHPRLAAASETLWDALDQGGDWARLYVGWEMLLLQEMGFGLDLTRCAVTGAREGLAYVSPRSGHAVSAQGAGAYAPRLLALPPMLGGPGEQPDDGLADALALTGHFLDQHLAAEIGKPLPAARARLLRRLTARPSGREGA